MNANKINVLVMSLGQKFGGAEIYTINLLESLNREKVNVYCAVRKNSTLENKLGTYSTISLDLSKHAIFNTVLRLRDYVKKKNINIIHANGINAMFLISFLSSNIKKISVIHGDTYLDHQGMGFVKERLLPRLEVMLCNKFDMCVAVSNSLKSILVRRGVISDKIRVVYNGINILDYSLVQTSHDYINICAVGNLLPIKNHILLLKAMKEINIKYPGTIKKCDIYGMGECEQNLKQYIIDNNLYNVNLKGFEENVRNKLSEYQVFVQPSRYESFGLSVIEAINAGCFVISSEVGGMKEIFQKVPDRVVMFKNDNIDSLVNCISWACENRDSLSKGMEKALDRLRQFFSIQASVEQMEHIYAEVTGFEN